jgi:hypothetical protein
MKGHIRTNSNSTYLINASKIEGGSSDDFEVYEPEIGENLADAIDGLRMQGYVIFEVFSYALTIDDIIAKHEEEI